jgi:hypothetical protein
MKLFSLPKKNMAAVPNFGIKFRKFTVDRSYTYKFFIKMRHNNNNNNNNNRNNSVGLESFEKTTFISSA